MMRKEKRAAHSAAITNNTAKKCVICGIILLISAVVTQVLV